MSTFYGIGVGPGDPDLLTKQAIDRLNEVDRVIAPAAESSDRSMALETARPFLPDSTPIDYYFFPLTANKSEIMAFWNNAAAEIETHLEQHSDVAFLTLGDPGFYSTCSLIKQQLSEQVSTKLLPGITSIQAAASRIPRPLTKKNELFTTLTGHQIDHLQTLLDSHDTIAVLKPNQNVSRLKRIVKDHPDVTQATLVSRCGQENEEMINFLNPLPDNVDYFSVLLIFTHS